MSQSNKLGIIAGNRLLPVVLIQRMRENNPASRIIAVCFKGETSSKITGYADKVYWLKVGKLKDLKSLIENENLKQWVMAGQINPLYIFRKKYWDQELKSLVQEIPDFRPHTLFEKMIEYLEKTGIEFIDSTYYLKEDLADSGEMSGLGVDNDLDKNINFGLNLISKFVELDVGQTVVVKNCSAVGLESLEGTDRTIKRAYRLAGPGCVVFKFCKSNQDLRFDVPVVGMSTLKLLKKIKAAGLVLEKGKTIILEKDKFLSLAKKWQIAVIGKERVA